MNEPIRLTRKLIRKNESYEEEVYLSDLSSQVSTPNLDIFCFGSSLFRAGAVLPIRTSNWVIQCQTEGRTNIASEGENYRLQSGDLLVVPPQVPYSYRVPDKNDMRKFFLILRSGPIPDIMLGMEIRQHGMKVTPDDPVFFRELILKIGTLRMENFIRAIKIECLDKMIFTSAAQLRIAVKEYLEYWNHYRPHEGLGGSIVMPYPQDMDAPVRAVSFLGGLLHGYRRARLVA